MVDAPTCKAWDYSTNTLSDRDFDNPYAHWKITNAYAVGGPQCTVRAVQALTGLQLHRVIVIDFGGFSSIVDALGGIQMTFAGPVVDGGVTIITGTLDYGQGHLTPFAQVLHDRLGIPVERVRLLQGDSDALIAGGGTGGSKSIMASGTAILEASDKVIEKGRQIAASILEASSADIEFSRGWFTIAGTDRAVHIMDVAQRLQAGLVLPDDVPHTLDVQHVHEHSPSAFPNGCHIAEVEVDAETGTVEVVRYSMVNDFGTLINPMLVEGQIHGGVAQGIGNAFYEQLVYDEQGQLLNASFMDYLIPTATDVPPIETAHRETPSPYNPVGLKGVGEAGCIPTGALFAQAVEDALAGTGVEITEIPLSPNKLFDLIEAARR